MKNNEHLKIAKAIYLIILIVTLKVVFIIPRLVVWVLNFVEKILYIVKKTLTYLIEIIEEEVIK